MTQTGFRGAAGVGSGGKERTGFRRARNGSAKLEIPDEAFHRNLDHLPAARPRPGILAEGIVTASPLRRRALLEAIRESGGTIVRVAEEAIPGALAELGRRGLFVEPTTAVAYAGLAELRANGALEGTTVPILTGSGLKASAIIQGLAVGGVS